jgi:rhodanese-related sulfurtransferase
VKLPEAIRIPADKLEEQLTEIPKNKSVVAYCT